MKQIAGVGEPLPQVVLQRPAEVAGVGQMDQTFRLAVEKVFVPDKSERVSRDLPFFFVDFICCVFRSKVIVSELWTVFCAFP